MITRHRSDNEDAIINRLIMETPGKNVKKDGICLLGSRPIDPKQGSSFSNTEMKLKCHKYCENSKEIKFFSDVLCLSRPCVLNVCLAKAKNNYLTNTPKSENAVSI